MQSQAQHFRWTDRPSEHLRDGIDRRFVTSASAMIGEVRLQRGALVPPHAHDNEQFTHVISGALRVTLGAGDQVVIVGPGEVILIPPGLLHAVEAMEDTVEYDVFTPPRQDWIDPGSDFLRG